MFPIPFNFPFRKANGDISTIGAEISAGGGGSAVDQTARNRANDAYALAETANTTANTANTAASSANQRLTGLYDNLEINGCINILENVGTTNVSGGCTYTVNSDKSIQIHGTTLTDNSSFYITPSTGITLKKGNWKLTALPENIEGGYNKIQVAVQRYVNNEWTYSFENNRTWADRGSVAPEEKSITLNEDTIIRVICLVYRALGSIDLTLKPMISITSLNLSYDDYVQYAKSNRELTDDISNKVEYTYAGNVSEPDNYTKTGIYQCYFVFSPMDEGWGILIVTVSDLVITQFAINSGGIAFRRRVSGTWSSWTTVALS